MLMKNFSFIDHVYFIVFQSSAHNLELLFLLIDFVNRRDALMKNWIRSNIFKKCHSFPFSRLKQNSDNSTKSKQKQKQIAGKKRIWHLKLVSQDPKIKQNVKKLLVNLYRTWDRIWIQSICVPKQWLKKKLEQKWTCEYFYSTFNFQQLL